VSDDAQPSLTNTVTVTGGSASPASMTATDVTAVDQRPDLSAVVRSSSRGVPYAPFARGDGAGQRDTYAVTVRNGGFAPTRGPVTVAAELPAGLRPLSLSAPGGWSCDVAAAACTTGSGVAMAGGQQVPIVLEVAVAGDAPSSVLPRFTVSGGGEVDGSNDDVVVQTSVRG
jgi:hypothetical protein